MMRKLLFAIMFVCFGWAPMAHADKMVNVEYIHKLIEQRWGIVIPYSSKLSTPKVAANMKYLLTLVDMTNRRINGTATTDYGNGEYATMVAADTVAANTAITKLARIKPKFTITTTPDTSEFTFRMSAKGRFVVDWGDNTATEIVRDDINQKTYTHKYKRAGEYKIKMTGRATGYNTSSVAAVSFGAPDEEHTNTTVAGISGSLGAIFGTIGDGKSGQQQPKFYKTFYKCANLSGTIPENLFAGISGTPASSMFGSVFYGCGKLSGSIPNKLFGDLNGSLAVDMFSHAFSGCGGLTGEIPAGLFGKLSGAPREYMFYGTFSGCGGLTGKIPAGLFGDISGNPADGMFAYTFMNCGNLSGSIPENLFGNLSGAPADGMFNSTFRGCGGLTGRIPGTLFAGISGDAKKYMFYNTFKDCAGLDGSIPDNMFAGIMGQPRENMFNGTFAGCSNLSGPIPNGLFGNLSGAPAADMFAYTFMDCNKLSGAIPADLFGNISGAITSGMYNGTFRNCSGLAGSIPNGLFGVFSAAVSPVEYVFYGVFHGCDKLTGCVPDGLFGDVGMTLDQIVQENVPFAGTNVTAEYCSLLEPKFTVTTTADTSEFKFNMSARGLFKIDWGDGTSQIVNRTNTTNATYSHEYDAPGEYKIGIGGYATGYSTDAVAAVRFGTRDLYENENLTVAKIDGSLGAIFPTIGNGDEPGQQPCFTHTFCRCNNLTGTIPENLFTGIHGAPVPSMFFRTFYNLSGLTGEIPDKLFGDLVGAPAKSMFEATFYNCYKLSGEIPANLFTGIKGTPASGMFNQTFRGCGRLTGEIPAGLFGDISGPAAEMMFYWAFYDCAKLTGCVPDGLFGDVGMTMDEIIAEYEPFRGAGVAPEYCSALAPKFTVTTSADTSEFKFDMSARGLFKIDWGDGTSEVINRTNTTRTTYSHEYDAPGEYQIGIGGYATGYSTVDTTPAIKFGTDIEDEKNTTVAGIAGSLGAIFGTIDDGSAPGQQPRFYKLFRGCNNLAGTIPENLFAGISGAPVSYMFYGVFARCSKLSGGIPSGLFGEISGAPANQMFNATFWGCSGLSGPIPAGLFGELRGAPQRSMFQSTFYDCNGLTGEIPAGLFGELSGETAPYMFQGTFVRCSGLTGEIPTGLFGNLYGDLAERMFYATFDGCRGLTGPSPKIGDKYLYEIWPGNAEDTSLCYYRTGLSDYDDIPETWK